MMTLDQYLNQTDPVRFPTVMLETSQLTVHNTVQVAGETRSLVSINSTSPLLEGVVYCLVDDQLWTIDRDGNPYLRSVFRIQ